MSKIKKLDNLTIQKIAAGEVIERPSSIVKELVENSLDAGSKNIVIEIINGGKAYIRVTDDGEGMNKEDIALAFQSHSTSKLTAIEDLYSIMSLGFRGEALPSISSVSQVEVISKAEDSQGGIQAYIENGEIASTNTIGTPKGTTIIVRDLFYNLPVRKKFLKSDISEGNHISDMVYKLALGNHNTSFTFIRDNKTIFKTSNKKSLKDNIYTLLGIDISQNLIPIKFERKDLTIKGYLSNNTLYRGNRGHQYIYINGRYIVNHAIAKIIENQYKSLIPINRFPIFILYIEMDPGELDVNIHPSKQEIKFVHGNQIYGIINNIVEEVVRPSLEVPKIEFKKEKIKEDDPLPLLFQQFISDSTISEGTNDNVTNNKSSTCNIDKNIKVSDEIESYKDYNDIIIKDFTETELSWEDSPGVSIDKTYVIDKDLTKVNPIGVAFGTYIIAENQIENKLYFVDQHAAHERIMYEKYKIEYENEKINTQQLLAPDIIDLTNSEMTSLMNNLDLFKDLGFDLEQFGPSSIAIRGVPLVFGVPNPRSLFLDIIDNLDNAIKSNYDTRLEKIMKIACTNAIKSGDKLSNIEIMELFKDLQDCDNPFTCPHGRPIIYEMKKSYLEKKFLRIT